MKKTLLIVLSTMLMLGYSVTAGADAISITKDIGIHVGVNDLFGFQVWDTELDIFLPAVNPGTDALGDLHIIASTNRGNPWFINAASAGLVGSIQAVPQTLPVVITTFDGGAGPVGTFVSDLTLTPAAQAIYSSGVGEGNVAGLEIASVFVIPTTINTQQDLYEGTIQLTMTE